MSNNSLLSQQFEKHFKHLSHCLLHYTTSEKWSMWTKGLEQLSVQTWQFAFNEKYSWFSPRAFFKGGLCHGRKRSVMLTLESLLRCCLIRESPWLPLTHLPSRAATPFSLSQWTPPGLASLCCNKYMFSSFYCEILGWRKVILVIVQIFEDRIFFLSSPNYTYIICRAISHRKVFQVPKAPAHPPLDALCLENAPHAS